MIFKCSWGSLKISYFEHCEIVIYCLLVVEKYFIDSAQNISVPLSLNILSFESITGLQKDSKLKETRDKWQKVHKKYHYKVDNKTTSF